ncbi:MAG TPA: hypothetical protein VMM36_16445 [Opitutaceae bacterium]|nr:hypothetical protein [Opitutaceae bacterium]
MASAVRSGKRKGEKSRLSGSVLRRKARQGGRQELSEALQRVDLRLARSFVGFLNGDSCREAFDWVPDELSKLATAAKIQYQAAKFPDMSVKPDPMKATPEVSLRWAAAVGVYFIECADTSSNQLGLARDEFRHVRTYLSEQLAPFQLITVWQVGNDGTLKETAIPRLDSVERCVAYVLGLMLLDRHNLRRGIKRCRKQDELQFEGKRIPGSVVMHFFLDLPNSKRLYCSEKHAATDRKRRERADPTARKSK